MCSRTCCTLFCSSSRIVTLPCPSTRETGSITTLRSVSGRAAVSRDSVTAERSVIVEQSVPELGRLTGDQLGEKLPDRFPRGRAARQEVVDLDHVLDRVDLLQRQRQLGIIRNETALEA